MIPRKWMFSTAFSPGNKGRTVSSLSKRLIVVTSDTRLKSKVQFVLLTREIVCSTFVNLLNATIGRFDSELIPRLLLMLTILPN